MSVVLYVIFLVCVITLGNAQHVVLPRNDVVVAVMCVLIDK